MGGFMWYALGLSCGIAIGYDEIRKKIKKRLSDLYIKKFRFVDEYGNEISYQNIIKLLHIKK